MHYALFTAVCLFCCSCGFDVCDRVLPPHASALSETKFFFSFLICSFSLIFSCCLAGIPTIRRGKVVEWLVGDMGDLISPLLDSLSKLWRRLRASKWGIGQGHGGLVRCEIGISRLIVITTIKNAEKEREESYSREKNDDGLGGSWICLIVACLFSSRSRRPN
jgi:hypothetical protein